MTDLAHDLPDVLSLVTTLATTPKLGRDWRKAALKLADIGADLDRFEGIVLDGEVYGADTAYWEWAVCLCGDQRHEWRRDAPQGRKHWHHARRDAETELVRAKQQWATWERKHRTEPHLVRHLIAATETEEVS